MSDILHRGPFLTAGSSRIQRRPLYITKNVAIAPPACLCCCIRFPFEHMAKGQGREQATPVRMRNWPDRGKSCRGMAELLG